MIADLTAAIDPHWPTDARAQASEQPSLPLDLGEPTRPRGSARQLRARLRRAETVGEEFDLLRELRRRRQARTVTRKEHK